MKTPQPIMCSIKESSKVVIAIKICRNMCYNSLFILFKQMMQMSHSCFSYNCRLRIQSCLTNPSLGWTALLSRTVFKASTKVIPRFNIRKAKTMVADLLIPWWQCTYTLLPEMIKIFLLKLPLALHKTWFILVMYVDIIQ